MKSKEKIYYYKLQLKCQFYNTEYYNDNCISPREILVVFKIYYFYLPKKENKFLVVMY